MVLMSSPEPVVESRPRRPAPRDLQRVLLTYLSVACALLCGLPVLVGGWLAAGQCSSEGFRCLGWFLYGMLFAALVAAVTLPLWTRRYGLGLVCAALTLAFVLVPLVLGDGSPNAGTAFLGPGLAAWVTDPRTPASTGPLAPPATPPSAIRHWLPRGVAVVVLLIVIPLLGRVI